ncbi:lef-8 [Oryctes rhinoceros nudivirus]|uniref:Lef-8 n=3 Tax=Nudiviridae TaxID=1511852 RepID=A0A6B9QQF7_9VIRU|nr:lef-8 [Oryctes rhinoceros nudivirus]ACH96194.1 lef-8 [Oryctes rhinoceros nudivirus]QHG11301.1 lef-8 protein [Oryctes rhinoceros nudivirus]QKE59535.1 lef-8 [Oryctes rhinoceros nudivirus]UBO76482.1 LEF-8 [Oryctes rhinoceros nudivirus]UBR58244.1 LEF-8 protein [Oryctes rhinoceros nudivirus]
MLFETYLLCSYNRAMKNLMTNCSCYKKYSTREAFIENIIHKRGSYMACLCYEFTVRSRKSPPSIPIMLGSYLDYLIRGREAVEECRAQWGLFIIRGVLIIYPNFSTFDSLSMHVRKTRVMKSVDWFMYVEDEGLAISYNNKSVNWTFKRKTYSGSGCMDLLKLANPFKTNVIQSDYVKMFDTMLQYHYSMNDLKNRQIINSPMAITKYIQYDLARRKKQKTTGCQKLSVVFETGNLYPAFNKKNAVNPDETSRQYNRSYHNTMHEGRSNKATHLLPNVVRSSNAAVRNSNALSFPTDAIGYFCMLNMKDLKSAGEQNVLADMVIMSEESDQMEVFKYIKRISVKNGRNILAINGFLADCTVDWSLEQLVAIKRKFPSVTTQYYLPYVIILTRSCIPIKYSEQYDVFFSPSETTHYQITYPEADMLSITAKQLPIDSLIKTPPAKSTVSINNIKGSVAMVTSPLHELLMKHSLGVTCYMAIDPNDVDKMIDRSIISYNNDTSNFLKVYATLESEFNLSKGDRVIPKSTSPGKAMMALDRMYPANELLCEYRKVEGRPFKRIYCPERADAVREYRSIIFSPKYYNPPPVWNLRLRAAFGNPFGACIEDGVVIDSNILPFLPKVHYNACITVEFTFKTVKHPKDSTFITVETEHGIVDDDLLIGCLVTEHEAYVKHSKHTTILKHKIGDHYFYLINFVPKKTHMYDNLKIKHIYNNNSIMVVITGQTVVDIDVGSKIANAYGQKNIISKAVDLRNCWGITRDGRKVHAQIVYSEVSLVARVISGQLYNMFISNELAIGENGVIIAPVDLIVHTLHPYTNIKVIKVKNDTLTNINGFDSQNLSCTSQLLRNQDVYKIMIQVLGFHGFDSKFSTLAASPPIIVDEVVDNDDDHNSNKNTSSKRNASDDNADVDDCSHNKKQKTSTSS